MSEKQLIPTPINEVLKSVLLGERKIPPLIEQLNACIYLELTGNYPSPLEKEPVYKNLWVFSRMNAEEISQLSSEVLARELAKLDSEEQDMLIGIIPKDRENDFWEFVDNS